MEQRSPPDTAAGWCPAAGSIVGIAGSAACAVAAGWILARSRDELWASPLVPWCLGLGLAGVIALVVPRTWLHRWLAARDRRASAAVLLAGFLAVEITMAWLGWLTFRYYSWDFSLHVDILQETLRGHFFARPGRAHSYLGQFWIPQIALWLPLWAVWPDPRIMLLFQIAAYGAMALAVYRLAELRLGPGPWPIALLAAVVLAPTKDWALSMEMGNAPLLPVLLVLAALYIHRRRRTGFVAATIAVLLSREHGAALAGGLALYAWRQAGWRKLALALLLAAAAWLAVLVTVIMPWLAPHDFGQSWRIYERAKSTVDAGSISAIPARVLGHLAGEPLQGLLGVVTPFGLLPALGMDGWMLLLGLLPNLVAGGSRGLLEYHHAYMGVAIAALVAVEGARWLDRRLPATRPAGPRARLAVVLGVPLSALVLHVTLGYSPLTPTFPWEEYRPTPHTRAVWEALRRVPRDVELSGSRHLGTHRAAGRRPGCTWEYVSLRERDGTQMLWCDERKAPLDTPFVLIDRPRSSPALAYLVKSSPYGVVLFDADVLLLQRGADSSANRRLARWLVGAVAEPATLPRQIGRTVGDVTARSDRAVRAPRRAIGLMLYGWYASYCPGPYELTARLRRETGGRAQPLGRLEVVTADGTRVLAERVIEASSLDPGEYRELTLPFTLAEQLRVEVRLHSTGAAAFQVDGLSVVAVDARTGDLSPPEEACEAPRDRDPVDRVHGAARASRPLGRARRGSPPPRGVSPGRSGVRRPEPAPPRCCGA